MAAKGIGRPLTILLQADTTGLGKGLSDAQTKLQKFGGQLESLSRKATLVFAGVAAAGFKVVQSASDLNESISKSEVVFGTSAKAIEAWSKTTAQALGLSQVQSLEAASNFAILGQSAGLTGGDLADFSTDLTGLAADLASFNNTSVDEAITALAAGLRGESEPLRKYGVLLDAATVEAKALEMNIGKTSKQITNQDKVLARNALILEATTLQQGDFARTADGAANQQRILAAEIENSRAAIGQGLLPAYKDLLAVLVQVADWAGKNSTTIRNLGIAVGVLSAAVIGLNIAFKVATITVQAFTIVAAALRLGYLTLAAATGSATAAQLLAELTYKNSRVAALLYTAALGVQTVATNLATVGIRAFTLALLANPFTAVAVAITAIATALYKVWDAGKKANEALLLNAKIAVTSQKELADDAKAAKLAANARKIATNTTVAHTEALIPNISAIGASTGAIKTQTTALDDETDALIDVSFETIKSGREREKEAKQIEKSTNIIRKSEKAQQLQTKRLETFQDRLKRVQGQLDETRKAQQNYALSVKRSITNLIDFQDAYKDKGAGSFVQSLRNQADAARSFGSKITQLLTAGLNQTSIDNILAAGAEVGSKIADEILAGGSGTINEINSLVAAVEASATSVGEAAASKWFDAGVAQGQAMIDGIIAAASQFGFVFTDGKLVIPASLRATASKSMAPKKRATGGPVFTGQSYLVGEQGPELFTAQQNGSIARNSSMGNVNITINGAIDPEGTRRQLEKLFQNSARRTGAVSLVGATL